MKKKTPAFQKDLVGLLWLLAALFGFFSLFSYHPLDFSLLGVWQDLYGSLLSWTRPEFSWLSVSNQCGLLGAIFAHFLFSAFGQGSWVSVCLLFLTALKFFLKKSVAIYPLMILSFGFMVTFSTILTLFSFTKGGWIGEITYNLMTPLIQETGLWLLSVSLLVALPIFYFQRSFSEVHFQWISTVGVVFFWPLRIFWKLGSLIFRRESSLEKVHEEAKETTNCFQPPSITAPIKEANVLLKKANSAKNSTKLPKLLRRTAKSGRWELPDIEILHAPIVSKQSLDEKEIIRRAEILTDKLSQFSVQGQVVAFNSGPAVTLYEFKPNADVKISRITDLADDLSLALSSESVRIIAPIAGRDVVGIETSNQKREMVYLRDILQQEEFWGKETKLPIALGKQADGSPLIADLRKMPHLMVAGTTGSGKSVFVVSTLTGLLFRHSPDELKLILIDPKQVDLAAFSEVPHLLMPPIAEPKKAVAALKWAVKEMEKRYRSMSKFKARGLEAFNETVSALSQEEVAEHLKINEEWQADARRLDQYYYTPQPYLVVVVEEFGDLMAVDKVNVETLVVRLAQMARASGMHLILAMQSPRRDVVTGMIKTNIPGRISFKVASKMDSRIILDESGGERLLAQGDMLYLSPGLSKPLRCHAPWVSEKEIAEVTRAWSDQGQAEFDENVLKSVDSHKVGLDEEGLVFEEDEYDDRYDEVLAYVSTLKEVSASLLQRRFKLGYPRAARLIEIFERERVIGPANGSKPRQVLISSYEKTF